jgi:hypothetical protein
MAVSPLSPDDTVRTAPVQAAPPMRARAESHMRVRKLRPAEDRMLDDLAGDQLTLTMGLLCLDGDGDGLPYDPSARAAARTLAERLDDLAILRDSLQSFHLDLFDPRVASVRIDGGPLAEYLRGVYTWTRAVIRAFEDLRAELWALRPDWMKLRARLEDAAAFYLKDLEPLIRAQAARLRHEAPEIADPRDPLYDFRAHLDAVLAAARALDEGLARRFG